jgi:hypothetical protein
MDLGRPKIQSYQNQKKPMPLRPARRANSSHIIFFTNGCRMRKISRSDRFPIQAKTQTGCQQYDR